MNQLESIPVSTLIRAAAKLTAARLGRQNGTDRALWVAGRHYTDRSGSVELPKPLVDRANELVGEKVDSEENVAT